MWLSTTWCDFLYRRRAMGMMWLFPHDVTWARRSYYVLFAEVVPAYLTFSLHGGNVPLVIPFTYLFWMGGTFVFFIWWFGMKKGCGGAGSSALHVVVNDGPGSCAWQLMNQGSFGGSFGGRSGGRSVVFSALVFICVLCLFLFLSSLSFSQTVTSSLFIVSVPSFTQSYSFSSQTIVAEWLFVMQSSAGRRVVCSARGGLCRVCYNGTLYPSNEGSPLVFWWIAVTLLWPGRGDFSASGLSTFKKIALTSALDCISPPIDPPFAVPPAVATALMTGLDDLRNFFKMLLLLEGGSSSSCIPADAVAPTASYAPLFAI